ncbi:transcription factor, contains a PHD finger motif [Coemansia sp. RSA 1365]|nr:transcription factor, contains a PHD finger motif [Coemansia sp. RSA 1365]
MAAQELPTQSIASQQGPVSTKPVADALVSDINGMQVDNSSENGEDVVMKDKLLPKAKQVSRCSYCENNSAESLKTVPCLECGSRCHIDCIKCAASFKDKILLGDDFFHFKCFKCTNGNERFKRYQITWVDVVHIALFNLTHNPPSRPSNSDDPSGKFSSSEHGPQEYGDSRVYFHYKADVARFIDQHWSYFWTKLRGETWINSASSALSTNSTENVPVDGRFESGKVKYNRNGMWALTDDLRFPSSYDSTQQQKARTILYSFAEDGSLIELPTQGGNGRRKRRTDVASKVSTGRAKKSRNTSGTPTTGSYGGYASPGATASKRAPRGKREPKNTWSIKMWPDVENPPGPAHISRLNSHTAAQFVIESDRLTVWNDKGYRMAKASHGVEQGAWYFEVQVQDPIRPEFNLRIGWSQISGYLHAPCGYDVFSYSVRAKPNTRFHAAIGSPYGEEYGPGDTLGVLIYLPQLDKDEKQDLIDRKWKPEEDYLQFTYSRPDSQRPVYADSELPPLPVLANSELVYFKNGKCLGPAFQKLYLGKYYPAISSYMGGKVKVNLGPDFKYPPPSVWHDNTPIRPVTDLEFTEPEPQPESQSQLQQQQQQPEQQQPSDQQQQVSADTKPTTTVPTDKKPTAAEPTDYQSTLASTQDNKDTVVQNQSDSVPATHTTEPASLASEPAAAAVIESQDTVSDSALVPAIDSAPAPGLVSTSSPVEQSVSEAVPTEGINGDTTMPATLPEPPSSEPHFVDESQAQPTATTGTKIESAVDATTVQESTALDTVPPPAETAPVLTEKPLVEPVDAPVGTTVDTQAAEPVDAEADAPAAMEDQVSVKPTEAATTPATPAEAASSSATDQQ